MVENKLKKIYLEADIELHKETAALRERASKIINLPDEKKKQPDLLYFSAIFVSSGENLNHAYFLPSELVAAEGTIINKAEIEFVGPGLVQTEPIPETEPNTSKVLISTTRAFNILTSQSPGPASLRE